MPSYNLYHNQDIEQFTYPYNVPLSLYNKSNISTSSPWYSAFSRLSNTGSHTVSESGVFHLVWSSLFFIGLKLLFNAILVSAVQQCELAICIHLSPPAWSSFPLSHLPPTTHDLISSSTTLASQMPKLINKILTRNRILHRLTYYISYNYQWKIKILHFFSERYHVNQLIRIIINNRTKQIICLLYSSVRRIQ